MYLFYYFVTITKIFTLNFSFWVRLNKKNIKKIVLENLLYTETTSLSYLYIFKVYLYIFSISSVSSPNVLKKTKKYRKAQEKLFQKSMNILTNSSSIIIFNLYFYSAVLMFTISS